jgi:predicted dehydrogenase
MAEQLRLGVVGANPSVGWASRTHMPALSGLPEYEIAAVCTTRKESAEASAAKYEARHAYSSYRDLVSDPEVEVVDVCVRVPYHYEIVMAALEAGKHVYCEWPLGATTAQAEEMSQLAARKGLHTMVGLQARAAPSVIHMRQLIADGWVGRVLSATMVQLGSGLLEDREPEALWRGERANGANAMTISFGHSIDAFTWCLSPLAEVTGRVDTLAPEWPLKAGGTARVNAPDHVSLTGRLVNGALVTVEVGNVPWHASGLRVEVYGTQGTLVATANQFQAVGVRLQGGRRGDSQLADIEVPAQLRWVPAEVPSGTPVNVAQMLRRFADSIRAGTDVEPTFADAVRNHRVLDAIQQASVSGQQVAVPR